MGGKFGKNAWKHRFWPSVMFKRSYYGNRSGPMLGKVGDYSGLADYLSGANFVKKSVNYQSEGNFPMLRAFQGAAQSNEAMSNPKLFNLFKKSGDNKYHYWSNSPNPKKL